MYIIVKLSVNYRKKVIRIICFKNRLHHTEPLMRKLDILTVTNIYNYLTGQFIHRYNHNLQPDLFDDYYIRTDALHSYDTRQLSLLRLPQCKLNLAKRNLNYTGVKYRINYTKLNLI